MNGTVITDDPINKFPYLKYEPEFQITVKHSGLCLDIAGINTNPGGQLIHWPFHGGPNQRFKIKSPDDISAQQKYVIIECAHSGLVLDVQNSYKGTLIQQMPFNGSDGQLFKFIQQNQKNMFVIQSKKSGYVMDVKGANRNQGEKLLQWPLHGGDNQLFILNQI